MSLPKIEETPIGFIFDWEVELIKIEVTRLKQHSDRVTGEVAISTSAPGYSPHLHQANFNFSSSTTREKLAKILQPLYKEADWYTILEQLSVYTLRKIRQGEPVITLWPLEAKNPPEYLLEPFVIKNYPTVIYGDPSAGKSLMSQIIIALTSLPWYDNPLNVKTAQTPVKCLVFDYETDQETVSWQLGCIQRGMGLPAFPIAYRRCFSPLCDDVEQSLQAIQESEAELLIIDSLGPACGGEMNDAQPALAYFNAIRRLNITSITLAHNTKNAETKTTSIYGSVFFQALARSIWEVRKAQEAGEDTLSIGLFHRKPPPFGKLHKPLGFKFEFNEHKTMVSVEDPRTIGEILERMGTQQRITEALKAGPLSNKDLVEQLELSQGSVAMAVKRLKDKKQIIKVGEEWGLALL